MRFLVSFLTTSTVLVTAREIVFPPTIDVSSLSGKTPGLPNTIYAFAGLTTFANLPYVHCLADSPNKDVEKFDIAFLGAPFDTVSICSDFSCSSLWETGGKPSSVLWYAGIMVDRAFETLKFLPHNCCGFLIYDDIQGTTARPGARFGPEGIRRGSRRMEPTFATSIYTGKRAISPDTPVSQST
jgi:hypothetical protein